MMNDDQNNICKFVRLAASNRVAENEITAGLDTLDAVIEFCQRLKRQYAAAQTHAYDDEGCGDTW
jgi:hypothetical protein